MIKLLIADDEHIIRSGLENLDWESIGIEVCAIAENGLDAMQKLLHTEPDIVLSDIKMPGMSGLELAHEAKRLGVDCIFVFFSGYSEFSLVKAALAAEAFDYVLKPLAPEEIFECMQRAMTRLRPEKQMREAPSQKLDFTQDISEINVFSEVKDERAKKIIEYIKQHYSENCSLQNVSAHLNYSPVHLNRILKKNTGYTFHDLLITIRLLKSREYIVNTTFPILDIAEKVGICDQRYFSQVFKRTFGVPPLHYRKIKDRNANAAKPDGNQ